MSKQREGSIRPEQAYSEIVALADVLAPVEGVNRTLVDDVTVLRMSKSVPRAPVLYEPSLVFLVQGKKRGYVGSETFGYDPRTVLVISAAIPFECVAEVSHNKPLLSVWVRLRKGVVTDLLANIRESPSILKQRPRAIEATRLDQELSDTLVRLLRSLRSPDDARVLGSQTVREVIYRVLRGIKGGGVQAMVDINGHFAQVYKALQRIHNKYSQPLQVADLARDAGMSVSIFHLHFKQVTSTSPIQYIKGVRMHKARSLMLESNFTASVVAAKVGYKSASQFGREFKRFFGASPVEEVEKVRLKNTTNEAAASEHRPTTKSKNSPARKRHRN
jgi:AraC-like DNA-binding protein